MRRNVVRGGAVALLALVAALFTPERAPSVSPHPDRNPFVWGQDDVWAALEQDFDDARERGCEDSTAAIDAGLAGLDATLDRVEARELTPSSSVLETLEGQLFEVAPLTGACPSRVPELIERTTRLRRAVKAHSTGWNMSRTASRDRLYRLLYGSRAAIEELLLQMPEDEAPSIVMGTEEPSEAPSFELRGVTLHSGDVLLSRGGAPTSAFIARGNDYPGNFSHVALLHVAEDGTPHVIESHIESGVGIFTAEHYFEDTKLRIMVLRLRADHPALARDPMLPHRAATDAFATATANHMAYDFAMDFGDPSSQFCSEVAYAAYQPHGVRLWTGLTSMSGEGLTRWLSRFGVRYFETLGPSDLEYDPQMRVVAEYRDMDTLYDDHLDNAVLDVMLEGAEQGDEIGYNYAQLPLARLAKAYSLVLNLFGRPGPVPEGMSATTGLRVAWLQERHGAIRTGLERRADGYRAEHGRRPAYWTLVRLAHETKAAIDGQPEGQP